MGGTITPAPLTFSGSLSNPTKVYDGTTSATLTPSNSSAVLSGFVSGQGATYTGATGAYVQSNAGTGISVNATLGTGNFTSSGTGFSWSNYSLPTMTLSGTGTILPGGITSDNFNPVLQTVNLYQKIPSIPGISSAETSSDNPSSPSPSGKLTTLEASQNSSLMVIQPGGDDTSPDGILSVEELKN